MNNKNKKLALICGAPRSGSTLLYNSICSSNIFNSGLTENHFIPNIINLLKKQLQRNEKEDFMHFENHNSTVNFFTNIINDYLDKLYIRYEVNNLCLKSILFSTEVNLISKLLPSVYLIFIIRDPKDIISSMLNVSKKQIKLGLKPNYPRDMQSLCSFIKGHYNYILSTEKENINPNLILVKYEDLVLNTLEILNALIKKLNLEYVFKNDDNLWLKAPKFSEPSTNPYHSNLWNKKPNSSKIGSYKDELTNKEIDFVNHTCSDLINKFDY